MIIDDYIPPIPMLPDDRFWAPVRAFGHAVIPLWPCSDEPMDPGPQLPHVLHVGDSTEDEITSLDESHFNVGILCGKVSNATVLQVTTQAAQLWIEQLRIPPTPRWWSRRSRFYLFNYVEAELLLGESAMPTGLKLLNDGAHAIYPGSIYEDGRLVTWELSPDRCEVADLPFCFHAGPSGATLH